MNDADQRTTAAVTALVGNITGVDTEGVDKALAAVAQAMQRLAPMRSGQASRRVARRRELTLALQPFSAAAEELTSAAKILQAASAQATAAARSNPKGLSQAAKIVASSMPNFVKAANGALGSAPDAATRDAVMRDSKELIELVQVAPTALAFAIVADARAAIAVAARGGARARWQQQSSCWFAATLCAARGIFV